MGCLSRLTLPAISAMVKNLITIDKTEVDLVKIKPNSLDRIELIKKKVGQNWTKNTNFMRVSRL